MRRYFTLFIAVCVVSSMGLVGCGTKSTEKAADSQAAIQRSQELATVEEKTKYLIGQANVFLEDDEFKEAITIAKYILRNFDRNSSEAQSILKTAKTEWMKVTQDQTGEIQTILTGFGEE